MVEQISNPSYYYLAFLGQENQEEKRFIGNLSVALKKLCGSLWPFHGAQIHFYYCPDTKMYMLSHRSDANRIVGNEEIIQTGELHLMAGNSLNSLHASQIIAILLLLHRIVYFYSTACIVFSQTDLVCYFLPCNSNSFRPGELQFFLIWNYFLFDF